MGQPKLSDEELAKLLDLASQPAPKEDVPATDLDIVRQWVIALNIKVLPKEEGGYKMTPTHLWFEYSKWAKHPIKRQSFFIQLKKLFVMKRAGPGSDRYYLLDPSSFDTSEETYWKIRQLIRERHNHRKTYGKKI